MLARPELKRGPRPTRAAITLESFNMTQLQLNLLKQGLGLLLKEGLYEKKPEVKSQILTLASRIHRSVANDL